jgi:hypothetical protein
MSVRADETVRELGTKFLLFPQAPFLAGYGDPERVWISPPAGSVSAGPADDRMYVIDPVDKPSPYEYPYLPPFRGELHPPVRPDPGGNFDHLTPGTRAFAAAHLYGSARRVLDIWESYFGQRIEWFFNDGFAQLELIPIVEGWDNAQSGYGFMEFGHARSETGQPLLHALNFDVVSHEMGHTILFSIMGIPPRERRSAEFYGFHEACADLTAVVSMLHFDSVVDRLLRATHGNLYLLNELNRIAELADNRQIRLASNGRKLSEVTAEVHDLSRPLTGAIFDILVELFLDGLRERDLIDRATATACRRTVEGNRAMDRIAAAFDEAYRNRHFAFKAVLFEARDIVGQLLAALWRELPPDDLTYIDVAATLLGADRAVADGRCRRAIIDSFAWRQIIDADIAA